MIKRRKTEKIKITKMLWERKYFYFAGFMIGLIIVCLNKALGSNVKFSDFIIIPISCSFIFGLLLYLFIKEPERAKKEGRTIILSKEGLVHLALSFGSLIILGLLFSLIKFTFDTNID